MAIQQMMMETLKAASGATHPSTGCSLLRPRVTRIKFPVSLSKMKEAIKRLPGQSQGFNIFHPSALSGSGSSQLRRVISQMSLEAALARSCRIPTPPTPLHPPSPPGPCGTFSSAVFIFRPSNLLKSAVSVYCSELGRADAVMDPFKHFPWLRLFASHKALPTPPHPPPPPTCVGKLLISSLSIIIQVRSPRRDMCEWSIGSAGGARTESA